jgi:uncharacterized protein (DUF362 family)
VVKRRDFLRWSALTTAGLWAAGCGRAAPGAAPPVAVPAAPTAVPPTAVPPTPTPTPTTIPPVAPPAASSPGFFRLHPFIEAHPEAVFIARTQVENKTDGPAKQRAGRELAVQLFRTGTDSGIPLSHPIAIKANVTGTQGQGQTEHGMGVITDARFMEGLLEGMRALGFPPDSMALREGNWLKDGYSSADLPATGYLEMAERAGIHLADFPTGRRITNLTLETLEEGAEVVWKDCPQGVVFRRVGTVAPYNADDSWLLDVAKLKAHGMGMTLCVKNLQGMCVSPHVHFCEGVGATLAHPDPVRRDFQPDLKDRVADLHARHRREGYPRWDKPGDTWNSGYGMEMWAQRICDLLSVTPVGLCVIEGIYGRNGNGFLKGPGPGGRAQDFLTNVLVFGLDPFRVDIIGAWLAGHEPANFGLFHIARERGLSSAVNAQEVPLFAWENGSPRPASLDELDRVPLATPYLRRDGEAEYHLV